MEPRRLLAQFKCDCLGTERCSCARKSTSATYFVDKIQDVANTLADVMIICGIHEAKANAAIDLIKCAFVHYDEIRHQIDAPPKKRLCKEDLMHELGRKCLMTRMEAQITYSIIKRAFKAFYHGTAEGSVRNRALEAQLLHSQECAWVHAAKRTAQIFASYEGLFLLAQKAYEAQIKCAYKKLYDKLKARPFPGPKTSTCTCHMCTKNNLGDHHLKKSNKSSNKFDLNYYRSAIQLQPLLREDMLPTCFIQAPKSGVCCHDSDSDLSTDQQPHPKPGKAKIDFELPVCYKCNCPKLVCDCDIDRQTGVLSKECSQGPYTCQWVRVDEDDDDKPDPCIKIPEDHECPIDCPSDSVSQSTYDSESECECDCSENCECEGEDNASGYEEYNQGTESSDEGTVEIESEDHEPELPDIRGWQPSGHHAGCRVPINHIMEETTITNRPASIAAVEDHLKQTSLLSTDTVPPKKGSVTPEETPKTNTSAGSKPEQKQRESARNLLSTDTVPPKKGSVNPEESPKTNTSAGSKPGQKQRESARNLLSTDTVPPKKGSVTPEESPKTNTSAGSKPGQKQRESARNLLSTDTVPPKKGSVTPEESPKTNTSAGSKPGQKQRESARTSHQT